MIDDPSYDAFEVTAAYDIRAERHTIAHAIRAKGTGTITVQTVGGGASHPRTWNVNDGEVVVCQIEAIVSFGGSCTGCRVHIPRLHSGPVRMQDPHPGAP